MNSSFSISAVVPSYNRPDFLRRVLLAFASQTRMVDELVITDDGSSVDIAAGIGDVLPELPFPVILVGQPDEGFRAAKCRNNGIREATGDFLVFADQDIIFAPTYVETFATHARRGQFLVGYPVRLTEEETGRITDELIRSGRVADLAHGAGRRKVLSQYRKERLYVVFHAMHLRPFGPKLRSGVFGAWRDDLLAINGFDEAFLGWGNEDDNLGRRLHRAGITGRNVFREALSVHMYHAPHHQDGLRANREYSARQAAAIRRGDVRAAHGVTNPLGDVWPTRTLLHTPRR
jgi:glycosyltransferase involved in cell wall biosynthesis